MIYLQVKRGGNAFQAPTYMLQQVKETYKNSFHFIINNSFENNRRLWVLRILVLQSPAFLAKMNKPQVTAYLSCTNAINLTWFVRSNDF